MTTTPSVASLRSKLDREALLLKLATARANWRDAIAHAEECARLEDALVVARAEDARRRTAGMTNAQRRELAALLSERVKDKADKEDHVAMWTTARMLDQVNEEIRELDGEPEVPPPVGGRRIFVKG